jgi:hypothetical protein
MYYCTDLCTVYLVYSNIQYLSKHRRLVYKNNHRVKIGEEEIMELQEFGRDTAEL